MSREKPRRVTRLKAPARLQDRSGLEAALAGAVSQQLVEPLEARVEATEAAIAAVDIGEMTVADVELRRGAHGGVVIVEPAGGFRERAIGRPVIVQQAAGDPPEGDEAEFGVVLFTGQLLNRRQLRLHWFSFWPAPTRVQVVYLIG